MQETKDKLDAMESTLHEMKVSVDAIYKRLFVVNGVKPIAQAVIDHDREIGELRATVDRAIRPKRTHVGGVPMWAVRAVLVGIVSVAAFWGKKVIAADQEAHDKELINQIVQQISTAKDVHDAKRK